MSLLGTFKSQDLKRLCVALVVSCLLHVVVLISFGSERYHGTTSSREVPWVLKTRMGIEPSQANLQTSPSPEKSTTPKKAAQEPIDESLNAPTTESFFTPKQLTKNPQPVGTVDLEVPQVSLLTTPGRLVLKIQINRQGRVETVDIEKSNLPQPFGDAVAEVFRKTRFTPGEIDGRPVGSVMLIEITHEDDSTSSQ